MNFYQRITGQQVIAILNVALLLTVGPGGVRIATAQQNEGPPPPAMPADQLDQLVSPIALYPDPLLAQVLVASSFPTDVVQADRWAKQNKNLKGQQLTDAVVKANLPYDPSIISLIQFPTVLDMLSQKLDWTTSLGNAVLTQRGDVMDAVQRMRRKAEKMGNLKSSDQVKVVSNSTTIEIQPAKTEVIYVPVYNPQVIYVQPAPPPPPPGPSTGAVVATGLISFGLGVAVGAAASNNCCWYGGSMAWNSHTVVVANTSYNRTWATRGAIPPPPPYYRANGPYPAGRAPVNVNNVNNVNVNVNQGNTANIKGGNKNVNTGNVNTGNVNAGNRNTTNTANRNNANNPARNTAATNANANGANRQADTGKSAASSRRGGGGSSESRGYSQSSSSGKSSAFSGAENGKSEKAASQRGKASKGSRR